MAWITIEPTDAGTTASFACQDGKALHLLGRLLHLLDLLAFDHLGEGHVTNLTSNQSQLYSGDINLSLVN